MTTSFSVTIGRTDVSFADIDFRGALCGPAADLIGDEVHAQLDHGRVRIRLTVDEVTSVDPRALDSLVALAHRVRAAGGSFTVNGPQRDELFRV